MTRLRREPPRFRLVVLRDRRELTPRLVRVTLAGADLADFRLEEPAASVRVLLPEPGADAPVLPEWNGNEFLAPDGSRPPIRTLTPRAFDPETQELVLEVVVHGEGRASTWATSADLGSGAAVSGPGAGYDVDSDASSFLLAGDETALAAIGQLLEELPDAASVQVHLEIADEVARLELPRHAGSDVHWHLLAPGAPPGSALVEAVAAADLDVDTRVWVAGEAAAVQQIRRSLRRDRGISRERATIRGYWKHGRSGT